jgi:iron complex outermembrane receptor protein
MFKRTKISAAAAVMLGGVTALTALPAAAQETQRIEITGSSIRRIDAEASLPVQVLRREDITRSGATNVTDLLQRLPAMQGGFTESSSVGGGAGGFTGISIHNIGDTRTLVLLNGRRLTLFGGQELTGFAAGMDLNAIPLSAIERIEVLTDGASALYGADAIAGVVNFITRRNSTEGDISLGYSAPRGGARETRISATKGFGSIDKEGFNVMLSVAHDERTKLDAKDRNFGNTGKIFFSNGGKNYRIQQFSASAIPANFVADNGVETRNETLLRTGACPEKTFRVTESYALDNDGDGIDENYTDDYCGFDFVGELEIYPIRKRDTFFGSATFKLGNHELFTELTYSKNNIVARIAPVPGSITIPESSPLFQQYLSPLGFVGHDIDGSGPGTTIGTVAFYRLFDLGKRENNDKSKFYDFALGSRGTLGAWDYTASVSRSESDVKENISGYPGALAVGRLRSSGLLDPFVGPGQQSAAGQAAINAAAYNGYWDGGTAQLTSAILRGSRELMNLPAGPLLFGGGLSYQVEKFKSKPSPFAQGILADPVAGTLCDPASTDPLLACDQRFGDEAATVPYSADRKAWGVFGELVIPATKQLEFTTSLRYDDYSDFGNSTTAKASFKFQPTRSFLIRGSVGTGFHAPTVPQVNATLQPFGVTATDYTCTPELQQVATAQGALCRPGSQQYDRLAGGNVNLKPEKSKQASIGLRFEPNTSISVGADLWHVNIRDAFGQLAEDVVFDNPLAFADAWSSKRDTGTGVNYLAFLNGNLNLGREYFTGLDFDLTGRGKLGVTDITSQLSGTYMIREKRQLLPDGPFYSPIGNHNDNLGFATFRLQAKWANTFRHGDWAHTIVANYKSGYKDTTTTVEELDSAGNVVALEDLRLKVKEYITFDWQTSFSPMKNLQLTVGALNILDEKPPLSISSGGLNRGQQFGFDDRYYDSRGRTWYVNASYKF